MVNFFKKWYFWLAIGIHSFMFIPTDAVTKPEIAGSIAGSFLVITILFAFFGLCLKAIGRNKE